MGTGTGAIQPYYRVALGVARACQQIGRVAPAPLFPRDAFVAVGTARRSKVGMAVWVGQMVRREVRALAYGEVSAKAGEPLAALLEWLLAACCRPDQATVHLIGAEDERGTTAVAEVRAYLEELGYRVLVHKPASIVARVARIEAALRAFPCVWIDEPGCSEGLLALEWFRPLADAQGSPKSEPGSNWAAPGGDAFGLLCEVFLAKLVADPGRC